MRRIIAASVGLCLLAGCATSTTLTALGQAVVTAGETLASVAAANNSTVASLVLKGQLFCSGNQGIFAVVGAASSPTSVIGQSASVVAQACAAVDAVAVPVSPPADPETVPVKVSPVALPATS